MPNFIDELKPLVFEYLHDSKDAIESMDEIKEWNSLSDIENNMLTLKRLIDLTLNAIEEFEDYFEDLFSGAAKRDATIHCLDEIIPLPFYLEWFDGLILRLFFNLALEERASS